MTRKPRETFGSRMGMLLAMAGSAIGLGNIWRFPYMMGKNGGAAFILLYVIKDYAMLKRADKVKERSA